MGVVADDSAEPRRAPARGRLGVAHLATLLGCLRLQWLLNHFPPRLVRSAYVCINGFITIGLLAGLAYISGTPFVFPSLGPTAYLFFFSPTEPSSSPRNAVLGHAVGLACGYAAYRFTGMAHIPPPLHALYWARVWSAALSLASAGGLMVLLGISHPPAGATTLIVSLGIIAQPHDLVVIEFAVLLLTGQAFAINRLAGVPYPIWAEQRRL